MTDEKMPEEIWVDPDNCSYSLGEGRKNGRPICTKYIHHTTHEAEIAKRDDALEVARERLRFAHADQKTYYAGSDESNKTAQALEQINQILGGK